LAGSENFVGEREKFMFNVLINLEPVKRSDDGCDMIKFRSFNHRTCKTVLNLFAVNKCRSCGGGSNFAFSH